MLKQKKFYKVMAALAVMILSYSSCSGSSSSGSGDEVKRPYGPVSETTTYTYQVIKYDGSIANNNASLKKIGTKTINGVSYNVYQGGLFTGTTKKGINLWITGNPDNNNLVVAGGEIYYPEAPDPTQPYATLTSDPPVKFNMNPPVGVLQSIHTTASITLSGTTLPVNLEGYTLVSNNATVTTALGTIYGCQDYTGTATIAGVKFSVEALYKQGIGVVAGKVNWPPPSGGSINLLSTTDLGSAQSGDNTIESMTVLGPGNRTFRLDTYDVHGQFDADKYTHAKMLLELRWADDNKAKQPNPVSPFTYQDIDFGTPFGYFTYQLVPSPVSFLHPEENGKGYTFWIAYVSQAAKNEPGPNGTAYHIYVTLPDYVSNNMRVSARINYHLITP